MGYFISFDGIELTKTIVLLNILLVAIPMTLLRILANPIQCSPESVQEITSDIVMKRCFYDSAQSDVYTNVYKLNYKYLGLWIWLTILAFSLLKIFLYNRSQPKFRTYLNLKNSSFDESNDLHEECLKRSIDELSSVQLKLYSYYCVYYALLAIIYSIIFNIKYIASFEDSNLDSFEWFSLFKNNEFRCSIQTFDSLAIRTTINCNLKYNEVFRIFYTFLLLVIFVLFVLNTINFVQFVLLSHSKSLRINRIYQLLPTIDELSCLELASKRELFFKITSIVSRCEHLEFENKVVSFIRQRFGLHSLNSLIYDSKVNNENNIEMNENMEDINLN